MRQTWRWFGPKDSVSIDHMLQAGVEGVVTALHHLPNGAVWSVDEINKRKQDISKTLFGDDSGLTLDVMESLPVSEDIKRQSNDWRSHIENYKTSIRNLAKCGIHIVCYNFMPVIDWTRTELAHRLPNGATCMRFDLVDFAVFDIHILNREGAISDFTSEIAATAEARYDQLDKEQISQLVSNVICGLPGTEQGYSLDDLRSELAQFNSISAEKLRRHQFDFLEEIIPVAEDCGVRMCCHPDDPPFPLLGLPRVMSTEADYKTLTETINSPSNGITFCSGSLGAYSGNDLPGMMTRLGSKVHFMHLRNVKRETEGDKVSFHEAAHLSGDTNMVSLVQAILDEETSRRELGRKDWSIPFRPDHGQDILFDLETNSQPGYPAVGRLKGLAELRGIMMALEASNQKNIQENIFSRV
ncbi:MAG: mannonate dehydratase [Hyphomicrobiales bacterium]